MGYIITSTSEPLYDGMGWDDYWSANDWIRWHKAMKQDLGHQTANEKFVEAFTNPPATLWYLPKALEMYHHTNYRTISQPFIDYAKENQFYDALFTGFLDTVIGKTASVTASGTSDTLDTIDDVIENTAAGISNTSKLIKYGLPILVIVALYLGYKFIINTNLAKNL